MNNLMFGILILIVAATAWDMGMRAMPIVAALVGILNILAAIKHP